MEYSSIVVPTRHVVTLTVAEIKGAILAYVRAGNGDFIVPGNVQVYFDSHPDGGSEQIEGGCLIWETKGRGD